VRGQRRPQLVRRVGDQLLLCALRLVQRCQHRVEVGGEACEFVAAVHRDSLVQITRRTHMTHRSGELTHRPQNCTRGQSPEQRRRERATDRQTDEQPADAGDRRVRLGQRTKDSHQTVGRRRQVHRVQAHVGSGEADVPEVRG
jgi:hypothetical protein